MKKRFFYVALAAIALASCTNDEIVDVNPGDAIQFAATTGNVTRAEITTNNIDNFKVWSFYAADDKKDAGAFFNAEVTRTKENGAWSNWSYGDPYFWPVTRNLNFYSVSPVSVDNWETVDMEKHQIPFYIQAATEGVPAGVDLLYATNIDAAKGTDGVVNIRFRHALSQIQFKVKNTNANLKIGVNSIAIVRTMNLGVYQMPSQTTTASNIEDVKGYWIESEYDYGEDDTATSKEYRINKGSYEQTNIPDYGGSDYLTLTRYNTVELEGATEAIPFTGTYGVGDNQVEHNSLFMLPQTLTPSVINAENNTMNLSAGTYLAISCRIEQKLSDGEYELLWGEKVSASRAYEITPMDVAIPICNQGQTFTWEQGKKYIYTIVFGEGAGYDGTPEDDDDDDDEVDDTDQEPILVPISFEVTVDDFQDGGEYEVDMKNGNLTEK